MPKDQHHRRSIRLKGYDYSQPGAYFVTICTHGWEMSFGRVVDGEMVSNELGQIVWEEWFRSARVRPYVVLHEDEFVVMPNHIHGIIWIVDVGAQRRCAPTDAPTDTGPRGITPNNVAPGSVGAIVRAFKSAVTRRINARRRAPGTRVWQCNYYERIIRDERALNAIQAYIAANPSRWHLDRHNPDAVGPDPDPWARDAAPKMQDELFPKPEKRELL